MFCDIYRESDIWPYCPALAVFTLTSKVAVTFLGGEQVFALPPHIQIHTGFSAVLVHLLHCILGCTVGIVNIIFSLIVFTMIQTGSVAVLDTLCIYG